MIQVIKFGSELNLLNLTLDYDLILYSTSISILSEKFNSYLNSSILL